MNIRELKEFIKDLPDEMEVCSKANRWTREESQVYTFEVYDDEKDDDYIILVVE